METDHAATVWEGKHLRVKTREGWEYAERAKASAGVVIVALAPGEKLILTEQYRIPVGRPVIELPAGLAGDENDAAETFLAAARRELAEETGYEASEWEQLAVGPCTAGLSNEIVVFFRAKKLRKTGRGGGVQAEEIELHEIPLDDLPAWLRQKEKEGCLVDPKIFAGLYFLR